MFLVDLIINFLSAYEDEDKKIIDDPKKIAYEYLVGWFTIDLIAVAPINYIITDDDNNSGSNYNKFRIYCGEILAKLFQTKLNLGYDKSIFNN